MCKHFPGHGDTFGDTHDGYVKIDKSWDELKKAELIPFQDAINASVDMVMISHVSTPNITGNQLPASFIRTDSKINSEEKWDFRAL